MKNNFLYQIIIPVFFLGITGWIETFINGNIWSVIQMIILWILIAGCGAAIGYHRLLSHKSFKTGKYMTWLLTYLGTMSAQGSPFIWVMVHRGYHHRYADQERDPHTPKKGWFQSFMWWQTQIDTVTYHPKYAIDILKNPGLKFFSDHYQKVFWGTITLATVVNWYWTWTILFPVIFVSYIQENFINIIGHSKWIGYRNFESNDNSVNNPIIAWLTWGQGWHNNHHFNPSTSNFGYRNWEFDPTSPLIWMIKKCKI